MTQGGDWELRMHWIVRQMAAVLKLPFHLPSSLLAKRALF